MKTGMISESLWKRSILKQIPIQSSEILQGLGVGIDACIYRPIGEICPVTASGTFSMGKKKNGIFAFHRAVNRLLTTGAMPKGAEITLFLPDWFSESNLKNMISELKETAAILSVIITKVSAQSVSQMEYPAINISVYGEVLKSNVFLSGQITAGMDLVMTKYAGTEGAVILSYEREQELLKRFTPSFVDQIQHSLYSISAVGEAAVAVSHGVKAMHSINESGVFGALWEMAEAAGLGLEVDFKQIPIRQETIEVCELFHINPYQISSTGSLLLAVEDGYHLKEAFRQKGYDAKVIGVFTKGKDRTILHQEEKRYLEPPKEEELIKGLL